MISESNNQCGCPEHLAMASVPKQQWCEPYDLSTALKEGTIFPCLNLTFFKAPLGESTLKPASGAQDPQQQKREAAMNRLMEVSFAVNDLTLYLDTHPDCSEGLSLFCQLAEERLHLLADYARDFEPLTQLSMITGELDQNEYRWPEGPMPWEGACV